jgi:hypothetical protein
MDSGGRGVERIREGTELNGAVLHEGHGGSTKNAKNNKTRKNKNEKRVLTAKGAEQLLAPRPSWNLRVLRVEPLR